MSRKFWTDEEVAQVLDAYASAKTSEELDLAGLAKKLGRSYHSVSIKAGRLGVSDIKRKGVIRRADAPKYANEEDRRAGMSLAARERMKRPDQPFSFRGRKHSDVVKRVISEKSSAFNKSLSASEKSEIAAKALRTKVERYGSANPSRSRGSWKAGWREIGGKRNYYRSRWEANYARYLEWLKSRGQIADWQHEPETFWFDAIKRGVRSYLPDFRVWELDGSTKLYEIKGWMDARSKTTLRRMAKYHPDQEIILVREKQYNAVARIVRDIIPDWECSDRSDRL